MIRELRIEPIMTDEEADKFLGTTLHDKDCRRLINYDADVYDALTGKVLAKFRRRVVPRDVYEAAFDNLKQAASPSMNRGTASGNKRMYNTVSTKPVRKAGYKSNTVEISDPVNSGIIGYFDRNPRFPYCRQTAYNLKHFAKFKKADGSIDQRKFYDMEELIASITPDVVAGIFHCRYSTSGDYRDERNNQPLLWNNTDLGLVFNGVISMKTKIEMEAEYGIGLNSDNDGEIVLKLYHTKERLKEFLETTPGSFAGAIMNQNKIIFGRNERRPAWIANKRHGVYFASTLDIFLRSGFKPLERGDSLDSLKPGHVYEWAI